MEHKFNIELNLTLEIVANPLISSSGSNSREETNGGSQNTAFNFFNIIEDNTSSAYSGIRPHNRLKFFC